MFCKNHKCHTVSCELAWMYTKVICDNKMVLYCNIQGNVQHVKKLIKANNKVQELQHTLGWH